MKSIIKSIVMLLLFLGASSSSNLFATENIVELNKDSLFKVAADKYEVKSYKEALEDYLLLYSNNYTSMELLYNMGNTYYKINELGKAILMYKRCINMYGSDADVSHNLELALLKTVDKVENKNEFIFYKWFNELAACTSSNMWILYGFIVALIGGVLFLTFKYSLSPSVRKMAGWTFIGVIALVIILTSLSSIQNRNIVNSRLAVILKAVVPIKSSPSADATELFILHEGSIVTLINEELSAWKEIKIADGSKGWIESANLEKI